MSPISRRQMLYLTLVGGIGLLTMKKLLQLPKTEKMPVLFIGHGNPMNALVDNYYSMSWQSLSMKLPTPQAILVISAHWETRGTLIQSSPNPKQIYDFRGFPQELFDLKYQPSGHPILAEKTHQLLPNSQLSQDWGLDHGAWSVLNHLYPFAKVPVFQLSIDKNLSMQGHFELANNLQKLRNHGVLILGSGNIVHNLRAAKWEENPEAYDWSQELDLMIRDLVLQKNYSAVVDLVKTESSLMNISHPTLEHFIPLLYSLGSSLKSEQPQVVTDGIDMGSISMTSFLIK